MGAGSRHLSVYVHRPVAEVYAFVADPGNLPAWAAGLGGPMVRADGEWFVETPDGRARVRFATRNEFGVLDHEVLTPSGETVYMPMRAIADGDNCEVVLTVRRTPAMTDADFERDTALVDADLATLKKTLETGDGG